MAQVIRFTRDYKNIKLQDSIILPEDHGKTEEEIEQLIEQKFQNWINIFENPLPAEEPVVDDQTTNSETITQEQVAESQSAEPDQQEPVV